MHGRELLADLALDPTSLPDLDIQGIAYDSRLVREGFLFVAIPGLLTDGHLYLEEARKKGARLALVERLDGTVDLPQVQVPDTRRALSAVSAVWQGRPSDRLLLTGITASNGKTTTAMMLDHILQAWGQEAALLGTIVYRIGARSQTADLTTPESLELQGLLKEALDAGLDRVVMEVSSISLEQQRVADLAFDIVCFNNVTREHIDQHGSFERYLATKSRLILELNSTAIAVLGTDDPLIRPLADQTRARVIRFGLEDPQADLRATALNLESGYARFDLEIRRPLPTVSGPSDSGVFPVALQVAGLNSVYNALSAVALALANGVPAATASAAIQSYRGVERRFEQIYKGPFQIYDDHFGNAGNVQMTLATLERMKLKKLHLLLAVRGNRGATVNRELAAELALWRDRLPWGEILVSLSRDVTGPKDDVKEEETQALLETLDEAGYRYRLVERLEEGAALALEGLEAGDVLLLGGAQGMDSGARLILEQLLIRCPELDRQAILAVIQDRVCG